MKLVTWQAKEHRREGAFCIFEDLKNTCRPPVKIHFKDCGHYFKHVLNPSLTPSTTKWHTEHNLECAEKKAEQISKKYGKGWVHAKCCVISTLAFKQLHPAAYDNAKMLERLMKKTKRPYRKKVTDGILDLG